MPGLEILEELFTSMTTRQLVMAAVDILVVAYLIYRVLLTIRGTRAAQMTAGLVLLAVAYIASRQFELGTLGWLLDNFLQVFVILIIVVFQQDIRRALMRMGRGVVLAKREREVVYVIEEVVRAADRMSRRRVGALIVFERVASLADFIQPGTQLDAVVSRTLLQSIFQESAENPLHDGAVIIRNLRVAEAGALLPLSQATDLERSMGTRHRAGLGITEETDAVSIVVSEERGTISVCNNGALDEQADAEALRATLLRIFSRPRRRLWGRATSEISIAGSSNVESPSAGDADAATDGGATAK